MSTISNVDKLHKRSSSPSCSPSPKNHWLEVGIWISHCHKQSHQLNIVCKEEGNCQWRMVKSKHQGIEVNWINHLLAYKFWVWMLQVINNWLMPKNLEIIVLQEWLNVPSN
jgi:hypothetical protein